MTSVTPLTRPSAGHHQGQPIGALAPHLCWPSPEATYRSPGPTPVDHHTCVRPDEPQLYPRHPDALRPTTTCPAHQRLPVAHRSSPNSATHGRTHTSHAPRPTLHSPMCPAHLTDMSRLPIHVARLSPCIRAPWPPFHAPCWPTKPQPPWQVPPPHSDTRRPIARPV